MSKKAKYMATLIHGNSYVLGNKFFEHGTAVPVTEDEMVHLEEHAVVRYKAQGGKVFPQSQFEFTKVDGAKDLADDEVEDENSAPPVKSRKKVQ